LASNAVQIDGAYGEGGGSVVRTAVAVSALTGQPLEIRNVRGGLRRTGVSPIDAALANALGHATRAEVSARVGDDLLRFAPKQQIQPFRESIDLNELSGNLQPGSAVLTLQTLMTPLARAGGMSYASCRGGTHVPFAPTYEYFRSVTLPAMALAGVVGVVSMSSAGYPPRGGGMVDLELEPSALNGFKWETRGEMTLCKAFVVGSELPDAVLKRGVSKLMNLSKKDALPMDIETIKPSAPSPGAAVTCVVVFERGFAGYQAIGERGKPMETVCEEAYSDLMVWLNGEATVDEFLADQMLVPAAFAGEACTFKTNRITPTLTTAAWVIKQFMPAKITILGKEGGPGEIKVSV
jgi:RNA 3'-terminal phosphate cyclase (ATP)